MNNTTTLKIDLYIKMRALSKAFTDLEELLNTIDDLDMTCYEANEDIFCKEYPFEKSFDELAADVATWADDVCDSIKSEIE